MIRIVLGVVVCLWTGTAVAQSDARAVELAESTVDKMGGREAWEATRYLSWKFFGRRQHYWDRHTGDVRIEGESGDHTWLFLINVHSSAGRVWKDGEEVTGDALPEAIDLGRQIWVNDSYWLIMPFKLLDPGVTLRYAGERILEDGRTADVLELTFDGVGYTPENKYEVFVARNNGLVEQWAFYRNAADSEPGFTLPWTGWQQFGSILIATQHGRDVDWAIAAPPKLPEATFRDPDWTP